MNKSLTISNIPNMNISEVVSELSRMYILAINKALSLSTLATPMLWGPPGVGKSEGIRELADNIEKNTGKKTFVTDCRLLLFNPIDLRGIPTSNEDKTLAVWLKPKIFEMDESKDVINILFLDEISAAPQSVQAAAYQITLDRAIGEHKLPDNCIVIAAGNRITDKSVATKMPKALSNRLLHFEVSEDFPSWKKWALLNDINSKVVGFLSFRQDYLMRFDPTNDDLAFATPRTWEKVSIILNELSDSIEENFNLISGLVGTGIATELKTWEKVYDELPEIEDIFNGKKPSCPTKPDSIFALISSMASYANKHIGQMEKIENSIEYAMENLSPDFLMVLMQDYMYLGGEFNKSILSIPKFKDWIKSNAALLNSDFN